MMIGISHSVPELSTTTFALTFTGVTTAISKQYHQGLLRIADIGQVVTHDDIGVANGGGATRTGGFTFTRTGNNLAATFHGGDALTFSAYFIGHSFTPYLSAPRPVYGGTPRKHYVNLSKADYPRTIAKL